MAVFVSRNELLDRLLVGHRQARRRGRAPARPSTQRCCAVLLGQNVLLSGRQQRQKLLGCTRRPLGPSLEAVEEDAAHLPHRLFLIEGGLSRAAALGVQCLESLG